MHYFIKSLPQPYEADTTTDCFTNKNTDTLKGLSNLPHTTQLINRELGGSDHHICASNRCQGTTPDKKMKHILSNEHCLFSTISLENSL